MKDFLNIFITVILTGFAIGISYMQYNQPKMIWGLLYLPWLILVIVWGIKINKDYE